jgi:outer membrane protein assembly factor BamB
MKYLYTSLIPLFLLLSGRSPAQESDIPSWTRFRGTDGTGIDTTAAPPVRWGESDFLWRILLPGTGHSTPVVWGNKIFVSSSDGEKDTGYLSAIDEKTGAILWKKEFGVTDLKMHVDNNLASPSPVVDESQVYTVWYSIEKTTLYAVTHDGSIQWKREFGGIEARHGGGNSPALTDKYVVFTREQETGSSQKSSWVAVDKRTGEVAWELERESAESNSFSTPLLADVGGAKSQLIFTSMAHGFTSVDPETGQIIWERKTLLPDRAVASPIYANGLLIGCRRGGALVLDVDNNTGLAADSARYSLPPNLSPYVPTPIVVGELLYLFMDNGSVACLRLATGEVIWKKRPAGPIYGSPICVGENLYCITKEGKVIVIRAGSTYELLGVHSLGEESFATPVMCGSGMVLRTYTHLMLLGNR